MKATIVPAQVTTVEDRVAGNIGFSQLILFAVPVFGGSLLYAILPPIMGASLYKIIFISIMAFFCIVLAIRIKGKITLLWLIVLLKYALRPKYYLFNKNSTSFREDYPEVPVKAETANEPSKKAKPARLPALGLKERSLVYATMDNPARRIEFDTTKKGGLNVRVYEIQE